MAKQTKLEDFEAFRFIVKSHNNLIKKFQNFAKSTQNRKMESKGLKQTVLSPISENKPQGGLIE